jgi:hypothetical protein
LLFRKVCCEKYVNIAINYFILKFEFDRCNSLLKPKLIEKDLKNSFLEICQVLKCWQISWIFADARQD